jgi:hypothetical protein
MVRQLNKLVKRAIMESHMFSLAEVDLHMFFLVYITVPNELDTFYCRVLCSNRRRYGTRI